MKKIAIVYVIMLGALIQAQTQNVGIGTTTPHNSALLDLTSISHGLLVPRVTLIAVGNGTSPVNGPATGLLVYNTGGALAAGFWYWNGSQWTQIGAGGVGGCTTLEDAYNCGGAGAGRTITANSGHVEITMPSTATNDAALAVISNKGTLAATTDAIYCRNTNYGTALYGENTNGANREPSVWGFSNVTQTDVNYLPGGVWGFKSGTGYGTGVLGQATGGVGTAGSGVTGLATNNNFGGDFWSQNFIGLQAETSLNGTQALQVVSSGASALQPSIYSRGWSQFQCSNHASGHSVIANNLAGEATWASSAGSYGYLGTASVAWWYLYYYNATQVSKREEKRNITYVEDDLSEFVMRDIENLKPSFYKYNVEIDEYIEGQEAKVRYNMHMGLILDETPDYIQGNSFSGIDNYSLTTMAITGVQYNRKSIVQLEQQVEAIQTQVQDFGMAGFSGTETRVNYNKDFKGTVPVVTITPTGPAENYFISKQDDKGFVVVSDKNQEFGFNWIAIGTVATDQRQDDDINIDPQLLDQLIVDDSRKQKMYDWTRSMQQETMKLQGKRDNRNLMNTKNIED